MKTLNGPPAAPGIALHTLLRKGKRAALRGLIGPAILDTIQGLDLASDSTLGEIAARLIEPAEALRDTQTRRRIIRMLPLPKARELAKRLGAKDDRALYDNLSSKSDDSAALETLYSFFGVVRDPRAPKDRSPDAMQARAGYALFHHQRTAADKVTAALSKTPHKVVLHMPTGAGKTRTAMHIVATHLRLYEPTVVCWLAHSAELLHQAADEFQNAWRYLGNREVRLVRFWGYRRSNALEVRDGVIVAGLGKVSALDNRDPATLLRLAERVSLTIIDEAHQAIAPTYEAILTALYSKRPHNSLLGLTATPGRTWSDVLEDSKLSTYFDRRKVTLEVEKYDDPVTFLIDEGYLARPVFRTLNSGAGLKLSAADVKALASAIDVPRTILDRLGTDTQRNLRILTAVTDLLTRHRRVLVFAPSVESARLLAAILSVRGHDASVVTNQTSESDRERTIKRFRSTARQSMVLVNYGVLTTGFDAPATSAALIARPTRSLVLYSQMIGRATRGTRVGGNDKAEIVTVVDPHLPGFGSVADAFKNWEDVWSEPDRAN
ncbi:MAG: DEAD/DEAH box helicase [Acidobacteria bacterium]|nr:DEAD/DEAH box helicase [Acidobacteriota bacterium]MYH21972.1 DEAD/DEAH box helicase [Acidobacteriota bacterium]MYK79629.1 DEAD/DEAH box helicase [Acidobacteriota bacterium]